MNDLKDTIDRTEKILNIGSNFFFGNIQSSMTITMKFPEWICEEHGKITQVWKIGSKSFCVECLSDFFSSKLPGIIEK